jgi:hypothetical protein
VVLMALMVAIRIMYMGMGKAHAHHIHQGKTAQDGCQLGQTVANPHILAQFRDQVRASDVNEPACRKGQDLILDMGNMGADQPD